MLGPVFMHKKHVPRQNRLEKITKHLQQDYLYKKWEIMSMLKNYGVHDPERFFRALLYYGYVEQEYHTEFYVVKTRKLSDAKFRELEKMDEQGVGHDF